MQVVPNKLHNHTILKGLKIAPQPEVYFVYCHKLRSFDGHDMYVIIIICRNMNQLASMPLRYSR